MKLLDGAMRPKADFTFPFSFSFFWVVKRGISRVWKRGGLSDLFIVVQGADGVAFNSLLVHCSLVTNLSVGS